MSMSQQSISSGRRRSLAAGGGVLALLLGIGAAGVTRPADVAATRAPQAATAAPVSRVPVVSYANIVEKVAPAVVTVRTERKASFVPTGGQLPPELREFFGPQLDQRQPRSRERGLGSGVIVSGDGYILTNNHVIDQADQIRVELPDRRVFDAKLVGADPASDLAVLKLEASNLPTIAVGDSDKARVGDVVLAVGNPLGVGQTVTAGIVSGKGRRTGVGDGSFEDFLQTDAPINQGNSGGALVNMQGELVGINSQILSPSGGNIGVGFAIPSNMAKNVMTQLIDHGSVRRSQLGVTAQTITGDIAQSLGLSTVSGALVSDVTADSPADRAGLRQGDVILAVNGRGIADSNDLRNEIAGTRPGSTVDLQIVRDGQKQTVRATLTELRSRDRAGVDSEEGGQQRQGRYGLRVEPLTPETARELELPRATKGVVVTDVDPAGAAADSGLQQGDVIEQVNGTAVSSVEELRGALDAGGSKPALLLVTRDGTSLFFTLRPAA
jgi:Do/DeqQ family serine protease